MSRCASTRLLAAAAGMVVAGTAVPAQDFTGLWVGEITVDRVSNANPLVADLGVDVGIVGRLIEETFIPLGDDWSYNGTGADQGIAWRETGFNDSGWSTNAAPLGYGETNLATTVGFGGDPDARYATTYFRREFAVADPAIYDTVTFRFQYDDAAVLYLNGAQILRQNLSAIYNFGSFALSTRDGTDEEQFAEITVPASLLTSNANAVAVEIHQAGPADDDLRFDLEMIAALRDEGTIELLAVESTDWRFDDTGTDLGDTWTEPGFDDAGWDAGLAPLGYGNGATIDKTLVSPGPVTNKHATTYFRKHFTVADPATQSHLDVFLKRDDGAVVYINGVEEIRSNMPDGPILYGTQPLASIGPGEEEEYVLHRIPAGNLVTGDNVLAVEVHQHVSEVLDTLNTAPTPTPAEFRGRVILHVDANGDARLLKQVIEMWKDGTYKPDPGGEGVVVDEPGRFVLVTDDDRIADFQGVALRANKTAGRRISSVMFNFDGATLPLNGGFAVPGTLTGTNTIAPDHPANPFLHKYHPDHDNLDVRFEPLPPGAEEAYRIDRDMTFTLAARYPPDPAREVAPPPPDWGSTRLGGVFTEEISGLHHNPITVEGAFEIERVATTAILNDEP